MCVHSTLKSTFLANAWHRYGYQNGSSFCSHIHSSHRKTATSKIAHKDLSPGRNLSMTFFQCGPCPKKKSATSLISPIHSMPRSNSRTKCHQKKIVFLDAEVFKGPHFADNKTLDVQTHCIHQMQIWLTTRTV